MSRLAAPALAAALLLAGCATAPPARRPSPAPAARPAASAPASAPAPVAPAAAVAAPDTVPSADALAVLAEIPEPLTPEERTVRSAPAGPAAAARAGDRTGEPAEAGGQAGVPVPVPTPVLGERPLPEATGPAPGAGAPAAPAAPVRAAPAPAAAPTAVASDAGWRVQLAAWGERAKAERYLAAARSQLGIPVAIEEEAGLFKVRSTTILAGPAADTLCRRAREAGFDGAFRFRGGKP